MTPDDFYAEDVTHDIEIAVTYVDLNAEAKDFFSAYIDSDSLTVVRVFSDPQSGKSGSYHGMRLQNPDFVEIRNTGAAMDKRSKYNNIRGKEQYASLPSVNSADAVLRELDHWETQNPEHCKRLRDGGQFFGFTQVGHGYLGRYTKFILISAVRDALEDATERRGSSVTELMDLVVRSVLTKRVEVEDFRRLHKSTTGKS